jgi:DNA-binding response OmpR family regulator
METLTKRILVVDDDLDLVESVTMILEKKGHEVIPSYGGVDGLEKAKTVNPDAIILDVMMPDLDGFETLRLIREISLDGSGSKTVGPKPGRFLLRGGRKVLIGFLG